MEIGFLRLIWLQIIIVSYFFTLNGYANVSVLLMTLFILKSYTIRINMWLLMKIASIKHSSSRKFSLKLLWYRRVYTRTMLSMLESNKYISKIFLFILIDNLPINCYLNFLLMSANNIFVTIGILIIIVNQVFVILCIHWILASFNNLFYKKILILAKQFFQNRFPVKFSFNLKMSLFIQAFVTNKMYGFSYGKFGIISMMAFTKVRSLVWLLFFN